MMMINTRRACLRVNVTPARGLEEGSLDLEITPVISDRSMFDLDGRCSASLNLHQVGELLQVLRGIAEGLEHPVVDQHDVDEFSNVYFSHHIEPVSCYSMRIELLGDGLKRSASIDIRTPDALVLMLAIEQSVARMAFGDR